MKSIGFLSSYAGYFSSIKSNISFGFVIFSSKIHLFFTFADCFSFRANTSSSPYFFLPFFAGDFETTFFLLGLSPSPLSFPCSPGSPPSSFSSPASSPGASSFSPPTSPSPSFYSPASSAAASSFPSPVSPSPSFYSSSFVSPSFSPASSPSIPSFSPSFSPSASISPSGPSISAPNSSSPIVELSAILFPSFLLPNFFDFF
jgi:hypothetical protein